MTRACIEGDGTSPPNDELTEVDHRFYES